MNIKLTLTLLILLVVIPALFYSVWELNRLADTETLMQKIYEQQQNTMLYSVNQYAWDRKTFTLSSEYAGEYLSVMLGYIDDADEVYINGKLLNFEGQMPPAVHTAYHVNRTYPLPGSYLHFDRPNTIAVRVYDNFQTGGIVRGNEIGIYKAKNLIRTKTDLSGSWAFRPGFKGKKLILLLGKIDDDDETYLNRYRIGRTGKPENNWGRGDLGNHNLELKAYYIPEEYLNYNGFNLLAVRVFDGFIKGGDI